MHSISQGQHSSDTWVDQEHSVVNSDPALDVNKSGRGGRCAGERHRSDFYGDSGGVWL